MIQAEVMQQLSIDKSSWTPVKFGDVVFEPKETAKDIYNEGIVHVVGLEHIDSENIHLTRSGSLEETTTFSKKFQKGDVLFGRRRAYLKKAALANFDGICSGDITVFRAKKNLLPELLPFIVNNEKFFDHAIRHSAGGLSPRVKFKDLANYEFLLPPKDQQAQLLELLLAMDEVVERDKSLLDTLKTTQSVILKHEFLKLTPKSDTQLLGSIGKWATGSTPSKKVNEFWTNGSVPWFTAKDIKEPLLSESEDQVSQSAFDQGPSKLFAANSLLIVWRSGILQHTFPIAKVTRPFTINQDLKVFVPNTHSPEIEYTRTFLRVFSEEIRRKCMKSGTTVESIDSAVFNSYPMPCPARSMQERVINLMFSHDTSIENSNANLQGSKALQKSLINQLF